MKPILLFSIVSLLSTSCATLNDSMTLGAGMGAATGAIATYTAHSTVNGERADFGSIALGAGIGSAVGLITSYFTHKKVEEHRRLYEGDPFEMHFGDLPPSPFVVPRTLPKKGK